MAEMDEVIAEVRTSTAIAVWEEKVKLTEDLENAGSWNMTGWRDSLGKLTGNPLLPVRTLHRSQKKDERKCRWVRVVVIKVQLNFHLVKNNFNILGM